MSKYYYFLILLLFVACKKDDLDKKPVACFATTPDTLIKIGDTVFFSNCSENAASYFWDFGDGSFSIEETPYHVYNTGGNFTIRLNAICDNTMDSIFSTISIDDQYFTDLKDKLVYGGPAGTIGDNYFNLDIDQDSIFDLTIQVVYSFGTFGYIRHNEIINIKLMNGYEVSTVKDFATILQIQDYPVDTLFSFDTIAVPKLYNKYDVINFEGNYLSGIIRLTFREDVRQYGSNYIIVNFNDIWFSSDYRYIVLRKIKENEKILAWLKVKVDSYSSIVLNSCRYFVNKNEVTIEDE